MLATEEQTAPGHDPAPRPTLLEHWPGNERMRHVPPLSWTIQKLDQDVRRRLEKLLVPWSDIGPADPRHARIEQELRAVCRSIDRVADVASRRGRGGHPPNEVTARVRWSLDHAVQNLTAADAETFGRRFPFHTFERSNAEPLWGALLAVLQHVQNLVPLIREIEPDIDERMYEGLVNLIEPLRREPIA
ncbi:MAG TPA: hypothetical protein VNI54_01015 [Thermoanaerobaculia bacterium]|nr:hypothetical protein [Thermoanaerobaculia bacterium]